MIGCTPTDFSRTPGGKRTPGWELLAIAIWEIKFFGIWWSEEIKVRRCRHLDQPVAITSLLIITIFIQQKCIFKSKDALSRPISIRSSLLATFKSPQLSKWTLFSYLSILYWSLFKWIIFVPYYVLHSIYYMVVHFFLNIQNHQHCYQHCIRFDVKPNVATSL